MLCISPPQFDQLAQGVRSRASRRMIAHVEQHFALQARLAGRPAVEALVEACYRQGIALSLNGERDLMCLLSLQLYYGIGVTRDRQFAVFNEILGRDDVATPSARIVRAWREGMAFHDRIAGADGALHRQAIGRLAGRGLQRLAADTTPIDAAGAQALMAELWPEKHAVLAAVEAAATPGLLTQVSAFARQQRIGGPGNARLLLALAWVFGIDFALDPMLPPMSALPAAAATGDRTALAAADAFLQRIVDPTGAA
ncbi:hypothetical protein [Piscinibacter sakaiensis]|nr:hypothetical protein [Piscinibacter sakaiensis]